MTVPDPESPEGRTWLRSDEGRTWLRSDEGRAWLRSDDSDEWLTTSAGREWLESPDGREWTEELENRGWARFVAGDIPPAPDWAFSPSTAPRIGARVRFAQDVTTSDGTDFREGELAIVVELRLAPLGHASAKLRTVDGRQMITSDAAILVPA
jgi:hypothetical protein